MRPGVTVALQLEGERLVRAAWRDGLATGQAVTTAVRPERMRLAPLEAATPPAGSDNALEGTVRDIVYTGSDTQYFVDLGAATTVMVRVPNDHAPGIKAPVAGRLGLRVLGCRECGGPGSLKNAEIRGSSRLVCPLHSGGVC